jgi:hypothetical protein
MHHRDLVVLQEACRDLAILEMQYRRRKQEEVASELGVYAPKATFSPK